jgi:hypothetical protein
MTAPLTRFNLTALYAAISPILLSFYGNLGAFGMKVSAGTRLLVVETSVWYWDHSIGVLEWTRVRIMTVWMDQG